jgi:hypothetical protein
MYITELHNKLACFRKENGLAYCYNFEVHGFNLRGLYHQLFIL